jgi:hypothetical protein
MCDHKVKTIAVGKVTVFADTFSFIEEVTSGLLINTEEENKHVHEPYKTTFPFDFNTSKVEGHGPSFESEFGCKFVDREFTTT